MNQPEIIALIIIAATLFLLVKYTAVEWWHVLIILLAGFFLAVYVPQIPSVISDGRRLAVVARHLADPSLTPGALSRPGPTKRRRNTLMRITDLFRRRRPSRRMARRQVAAIRAKTAAARQQIADTDAMLSRRKGNAK